MIYVSLKGRLCNQMFQIATAKALSLDNGVDFACSNHVAGICPTVDETRIYRQTIFKNIDFFNFLPLGCIQHQDPANFSYKKIVYKNNIFLNGYYQSSKYFEHREKEIRELYKCPKSVEDFIDSNFSDLLDMKNTCSVHIRRGDYIKYKDFHNNLSKRYYEECFRKRKTDHFVFFSDDIEWCKSTFVELDATFINSGTDIIDLYLMSRMKNNIIANSSFSWWGAWLNQSNSKVVLAPKNWFGPKNSNFTTKDLIPEEWIIIDA